jgi:hypothetical protein
MPLINFFNPSQQRQEPSQRPEVLAKNQQACGLGDGLERIQMFLSMSAA